MSSCLLFGVGHLLPKCGLTDRKYNKTSPFKPPIVTYLLLLSVGFGSHHSSPLASRIAYESEKTWGGATGPQRLIQLTAKDKIGRQQGFRIDKIRGWAPV